MRWFWGLIILFLGVLFLGANFGWWNEIAWINLWQFWPLLLIVFGISLIVKRWRFGWILFILVLLLTLSFIFLNLVGFGREIEWLNFARKTPNRQSAQSFPFSEDLSSNLKSADITIKAGASDINVSSTSDKLIDGSLESVFEPTLKVNTEADKATVILRLEKLSRWMGWYKNALDVKITNKIPVNFSFDTGASKIDLDLTDIMLEKMELNAGASSINLKLGESIADETLVDIDAGASNIHLIVPKNLGIKITTKTGLTNKEFGPLNRVDSNTYESSNFSQASKKIEINIDAGASSISLDLI